MKSRTATEEAKMWLPWLIFSYVCFGIAHTFIGYGYLDILTVYVLICIFLSLVALSSGRFFNYGWFAAYVQDTRRLPGHCAIVTGANSGSGYETAKELLIRGCDVIITCRSESKAETTIKNLKREINESGIDFDNIKQCGKVTYVLMDLLSKKTVDAALDKILNSNELKAYREKLTILVNNAGAWIQNPKITEDNIEAQWQANYLSPFYFTKKLLPLIKKNSARMRYGRIVNVASIGHMFATVEVFDAFLSSTSRGDINYWKRKDSQHVYGDTKCAQILHAQKLQELLNNEKDNNGNIIGDYLYVTSLQPGYIDSGFAQLETRPFVMRMVFILLYPFFGTFAMVSWKQGAQTSLHCILSDKGNNNELINPGGYHGHCKPQPTKNSAKDVIDTKCDELYKLSDQIWE